MTSSPLHRPDIGFIPTPRDALSAMLDLADLQPHDVVYDLGSGDGRFLIEAARTFGCRGVGIDIDPIRIHDAQQNAKAVGVAQHLAFICQDLFESDFTEATVVILYLLPHLNLRLRPQLFAQLRPGTRIISHQFDMADWQPDEVIHLANSEEESTLFLWRISVTQ
ncbi:MAG: class I SAM-dependent methyltransferase [Cyanobacteria bacterium P01_A01_bin.123]